nr:EF-10 [Mus musculus]
MKIPLAVLSSTLGGVPTSLGKQRGCGGRGGESPLVKGIVPPGQAGWLHLKEAGAGGGGKAGGSSPSPQTNSRSCQLYSAGVEGLRKKPICPWLTGSYRPLGLDFCACAMCLGGEATDRPRPPSDPFAP